jgi:prepilin-type N-terminal cleavage/methylation domain-containing protein/prepilin-type processing-associated H-X9-DG protein
MRAARGSRGFTLVELLVAMTILGILAALTLVGVQAGRESARRSLCANNLSQFGKAFAASVAANDLFPRDGHRGNYSFIVGLLPYLDQAALYHTINFNVQSNNSWMGPPNSIVMGTSLDVLRCPSDRPAKPSQAAWTNYAGNMGTGVQRYGYNGIFPGLGSEDARMSMFTDGTSQTAAMTEWLIAPEFETPNHRLRTVFGTPRYLGEKEELEEFQAACRAIDPLVTPASPMIKGYNWIEREFGNTLYNHVLSINEPSCLNRSAVQVGAYSASSAHASRGVNLLFVDGHVSWARQGIAPAVWTAIGSRNGGETVNLDGL